MYTKIVIENEVKLETEIIKELTSYTESCVGFWNKEGAKIYCENLLGKLGSESTNKLARNTKYDSWLLDMIMCDISYKVKRYPHAIKVGRTSSHVYVHTLEGEEHRIFLIHAR